MGFQNAKMLQKIKSLTSFSKFQNPVDINAHSDKMRKDFHASPIRIHFQFYPGPPPSLLEEKMKDNSRKMPIG